MRVWRDPLYWLLAAFLLLLWGLPHSGPLFAHWFPQLERPLYQQESFWRLALAHLSLVISGSALAIIFGVGCGVFATRRAGRVFRPLLETLAAAGQTFPPVAVLAIAVPVIRRNTRHHGAVSLRAAADFAGNAGRIG